MNQEPSFGRFIRERRRTLDLTQEELARRVGCAAITIRKIEADDARASVQIAERLAMALGIPLDERAAFVRRARAVRPDLVESPVETPAPTLEEIGREDLTGRAIRGYSLAERIGAGGMGAVYRAVQPNVDREVAMKIILPAFANHPDFIRRFEAEAQLVARLEHPHIVPLYDYWREPGVAYLVMRLLRGGSLQHLLQNGAIPLETTARLLEQICTALHSAHRIGVIHRDLKPANILLDEDTNAYLADFGIAKNLGSPNLEDQTKADVMIGSPQYMSPEQIHSLSIQPQTDIYCLGVVLYEMLTGMRPFAGPTPFDLIQQHISVPLPSLSAHRTGLPAALDRVVSRAAAKTPDDRYPDALALLEDFYKALDGRVVSGQYSVTSIQYSVSSEQLTTDHWTLNTENNPYKGLRAFGEADAEDFFGRETLVQQLLARLGEGGELARFLAVVGPSGSGKSSVVKAGLVPALRRGGLPGSENWFIVDLMPGSHPFEEVEAALLRIAVNPPPTLLEQLKQDERGLVRAARRCLPKDETVELVLVIDQFEELFTLVPDEAERVMFLNNLVSAVMDERSRVRVVLTMRADFTDRPLRYVDFGELVQRRSEFVLPLTPDELERAILGPAQKVGLRMEAGLIPAMIRDAGDQPGTLPLLQYALTELFEKREGRTLTKAAYTEIGGILGALGRRAEEIFAGLGEVEQATARQLFLRLVTLGEGVEDTRRRVLRTELEGLSTKNTKEHEEKYSREILSDLSELRGSKVFAVIDIFGKARLLTFDHDPATRGPTVEVAHEALLREWKRLREWLIVSRGDVRLQRILATAASDWLTAGRDPGLLLRGTRLTHLDTWTKDTTLTLTTEERAFLDLSLEGRKERQAAEMKRQERERALEQRSRNFLRGLVGVFAVGIVVAFFLSIFALNQRNAAEQNAATATVAQGEALFQAATALAARQEAQNQAEIAASNEADALAQKAIAEEQQAIAETERDRAETEKQVAFSRELAAAALNNLDVDPERSVLLALQALSQAHTLEAENALHRAVLELHLLQTLTGHAQAVESVAVSPDGKRLASSSVEGVVKVWDSSSGQELLSFLAHAETVFDLTFSPDSTRIATASADGTATMWEGTTGRQLLVVNHGAPLSAVAFSPDGAHLVTAGADGMVRIWSVTSDQESLVLSGHSNVARSSSFWKPGGVTDVLFSPDGKRLVTAGADQTARIWNAVTGQELLVISGHASEIHISLSPDGTRLATAGVDGVVKVWDISTSLNLIVIPNSAEMDPLLIIKHDQQSFSVTFSSDGRQLAVADQAGVAHVWDATTGQKWLDLHGHVGAIADLAFTPDGQRLITAGTDHTVKVWDITPGREVFTFGGGSDPTYSPDGSRIATCQADGTVIVRDTASGETLLTLPGHLGGAAAIAFSPDGTRIVTAGWDATARLWDAITGQELLIFSGHTDIIWDIAFSPDGNRLATSSQDGTVKVWDALSGEEGFTLSGHAGPTQGVAYSPDGRRIATVGWADQTVKIWDAATGKELLSLSSAFNLTYVAFSPDGKLVAAGASNGAPVVWDISEGEGRMIFSQVGHTAFVSGIAFSPVGTFLATTGWDGTVKVWDLATGREWLTLPPHSGPILGVTFSSDGTRLTTAGFDGVRVYALRLEDLVALARMRVTRSLTTEECQKYLHADQCP